MFRFGVVCGGSSLTAAQPYNNVVRVALETCAAVLSGAQSIFTCAYDEAFQIPTEFSAELALRTQQIIAYESGIARSVDPLGGSYFVEQLTDQSEARILELMDEIDAYGGAVKAIEDGWLQMRIARRALERKRDTDDRERLVVGQNCFRRENQAEAPGELFHMNPQASQTVLQRYDALRDRRDNAAVERTLAKLAEAAASESENIMPYLVDCCHAYATVGEMVARLKDQWGEFEEPVHL
jgi:methylmalonyl-CoA mutase N-terminal domain/subunit